MNLTRDQLFKQICWFTESGIHSSNQMVETFQQKINYTDRILPELVRSFFRSFAELQYACLQIKESPKDYVIIPIVDPHRFAHFLSQSSDHYKGVRPKEGQRVRFTVWDGDNAPEDLEEWTGHVVEKRHNGTFMEYIIRRDADRQLIKLAKAYIRCVIPQ